MFFPRRNPLNQRSKAFAFDLDSASLASLQEALPGWKVKEVNGATAASLAGDWNPGAADLLVVRLRDNESDTLGLCRFLTFCSSYSKDSLEEARGTFVADRSLLFQLKRSDAALLVLVPHGQENFIDRVLKAGAHSCLMLPIHAQDVASMLAHALVGNQPGQHTLNLQGAQAGDPWRDDGGQG